MAKESTYQMDTNYVLEKIQNVQKEHTTLKRRLKNIQSAYQNLQRIKKWQDKQLEYAFVTPLNRLRKRRMLSTTNWKLRKQKVLQQILSKPNIMSSPDYEKIECIKEENSGNNSDENYVDLSSSNKAHSEIIRDDKNLASNRLSPLFLKGENESCENSLMNRHPSENSFSKSESSSVLISVSLTKKNITNRESHWNHLPSGQPYLKSTKNNELDSSDFVSKSQEENATDEGSQMNYTSPEKSYLKNNIVSSVFISVSLGKENTITNINHPSSEKSRLKDSENTVSRDLTSVSLKEENATNEESPMNSPLSKPLHLKKDLISSDLSSLFHEDKNVPDEENHLNCLSSEKSCLKHTSYNEGFISNNLTSVSLGEKNVVDKENHMNHSPSEKSCLNSISDNDFITEDIAFESHGKENATEEKNHGNHSLSENTYLKNINDDKNSVSNGLTSMGSAEENVLNLSCEKNVSSKNSNEQTSRTYSSIFPCKNLTITVKPPVRRSARLMLSKKASFFPPIPERKTVSNKSSNNDKSDPSLGTGVSLKPKTNYSLKRAFAEMSESSSEKDIPPAEISASCNDEDIMLPDLDDSIFQEMNEEEEVMTVKSKKKPKPFQSYVRRMGNLVPKAVECSLKALEKTNITSDSFYDVSHRLAEILTQETDIVECENSCSKMKLILFYILKYLVVTYHRPVFDFSETQDTSVLLPRSELCLVSALHKIELDTYKGLLSSIVISIYQLVLAMPSLPIYGSCSMCRIFTKICKLKQNSRLPIDLCCDILKMKHKFSTMLIASVVGVWPELLLKLSNASVEESTFYHTITYYSKMWPEAVRHPRYKVSLTLNEWQTSKNLLDKFVPSPPSFDCENTVEYLMRKIKEKCLTGCYSNEYMLTAPLVIIAICKGWYWAKENVVNKHLVPNICKFVGTNRNENALNLFCKLYVEICRHYPQICHPEEFLFKIFHAGMENNDDHYMKDAAAGALIQLLLSRNMPLDENLKKWYEQNKSNPKFSYLDLVFYRSKLKELDEFTNEHMLLNSDLFL